MNSRQARVDDKSSWPHFCVRQRRLRENHTWFNKKNSPPEGRSVFRSTERPDAPSRNWREVSDTPRQFQLDITMTWNDQARA